MNFIKIAYYTFLRSIRDIKSTANMLLLPIVLILILGNALSGLLEIKNIPTAKVNLLIQDKGELAVEFEKFLNSDNIKDLIEVSKVSTYDEGMTNIDKNNASAFIFIEQNFTDKFLSGGNTEIKVFGNRSQETNLQMVRNIVDSFANVSNTMQASIMATGKPLSYNQTTTIKSMPISAEKKIPKAMDYYAVTMLVMTLFYGAQYGLHGMAEDYLESMRSRLLSTPLKLSTHIAGKVFGNVITVFLQGLILILFTKFVYQTNWGNNFGIIILINLVFSVFAVTLGSTVSLIAKNRIAGSAILSIIIPIMTFFSGGYAKIVDDSKFYEIVTKIIPNSLGHKAFFNAIYGDSSRITWESLGLLCLMTLALGLISILAGRRKLA